MIVVIGAGGDRDTGKRPVMGAEAAAPCGPADRHRRQSAVRGSGRDPRASCWPAHEPNRIRAAGSAWSRSATGARRSATAVRSARTGDAVIIAGKGHEQGQDVGGVVHPFSDAGRGDRRPRRRWPCRSAAHDRPWVSAAVAATVGARDRCLAQARFRSGFADARRARPSSSTAAGSAPGALFVAFRGERADGHDFAARGCRGRRGRRAGLGPDRRPDLPLLQVVADRRRRRARRRSPRSPRRP